MSSVQDKLNLLPESAVEFSTESYWDTFYTKRKDGFDWYGEYDELAPLLQKCISPKDEILVVGCGNSSLSREMWKAGYKNQTNIDINLTVVSQMSTQYPKMIFRQGDVTNLRYWDETYSCVLDKGTFDALAPMAPQKAFNATVNEEEDQGTIYVEGEVMKQQQQAYKMLSEINRVLKIMGRFVCVSLLQEHVAELLITFFYDLGWMIRVSRCTAAEKVIQRDNIDVPIFPVYVCVFTKVKKIPGGANHSFIEFFGAENIGGRPLRLDSASKLLLTLKEEMIKSFYAQSVKRIGYAADKELRFELNDESGRVKYVLYVVDVMALSRNPINKLFGVFITPQGREAEYIYGTHEGRASLAMQAGFARLAVFHLLRDVVYPSLEEVQMEIQQNLEYVTPIEVLLRMDQANPPIMTEAGQLGSREIIHRGNSEFSGDYVVEDVQLSKTDTIRRLIFLNAPSVIQSEVLLKVEKISKGKGKNGKKDLKKTPLKTILTCDHHGIMSISIAMLKYFLKTDETKELDVLVIGLGGGLLVSFLNSFFPYLKVTAVELDKEIVKVGQEYFGLSNSENERLRIVVDDGLKFLKETDTKFSIIMSDVDNKSVKEGLSCPPPEFLTSETIDSIKAAMTPDGIFVLNFVCRNRELEKTYKQSLSFHFPFIYYYDLKEDVNTVFFCFKSIPPGKAKNLLNSLCKSLRHIRDVHFLQSKKSYEGEAPWSMNPKKTKGKGTEKLLPIIPDCSFEFSHDSIAAIQNDDNLEYMCQQFKIMRV